MRRIKGDLSRDDSPANPLSSSAKELRAVNDRSNSHIKQERATLPTRPVGLDDERIAQLRREYERYAEDPSEQASILAEIGLIYARAGETARAMKTFRQSLEDARRGGNHAVTSRALESLGALHARIGEYSAALEYYHDCIRLLGDDGDPTIVGTTWMEIGTIYGHKGELTRALECFRRSAECLRAGGHHFLDVRVSMNIAHVLVAQGEPSAALDEMLRVLLIVETLGDRIGIAEALLTIGTIHEQLGGNESALDHFGRALTIARNTGNNLLAARAALHVGHSCAALGRPGEGLASIEEAIPLAEAASDLQLQFQLHYAAADACEAIGELPGAYEHLKAYASLFERYTSLNREDLLAELQVRFDIEQSERERERYRDEAARLQQELTEKNRELTELTLSLVQKSEFLDDLKRQLQNFVGAAGTRADEIARPLLLELENRCADDDWRLFELQFEQVHQDFLKRITERFTSLTPMELKICALTRAELATKDIARLMNLSVRNIQNHRYRLRKKLGLNTEEHLETFLASI